MDCVTVFGDNIWSESLFSSSPVATFPLSTTSNTYAKIRPKTEAIPTPPHSPSTLDQLLDMESSFTELDVVDPNSILDEIHRCSPVSDPLDGLSVGSDFPLLDDIDIKMESLEPYLGQDFSLHNALCPHGYTDGFCACCVEETFKTEILNDCMWPSGQAPSIEENKMEASSIPCPDGGVIPPRSHLDSNASKFSDILDSVMLSSLPTTSAVEDFLTPETQLETPSESSDTDTDSEEMTATNVVQLDHNYYFPKPPHQHYKQDISSSLVSALQMVSTQQESDDEIDVVNLSASETVDLEDDECSSPLPSTDSIRRITDCFEAVPKRGRRPNMAGTGRRVGRPCKAGPKRINQKANQNNVRRTYGVRAVEMDPLKRNLHNSMERMRRVNLKNCFDAVRCAVPALKDRVRAPKVLILKSALEMIRNLERGENKKRVEVDRLRQYQSALLLKLRKLRGDTEMG